MKSPSLFRPIAALVTLLGAAGAGHAQSTQSPYVETTSLTFLWNMVNSKTTTSTLPPGASPGPILDPLTYDPSLPISTDITRPGVYQDGGTQTFFLDRIKQALVRSKGFDENGDFIISDTDDAIEVVRPPLIVKESLGSRWQLLAVREIPTTLAEVATNPYKIYLSVLDRVDIWAPYDPVPVDDYSEEDSPDINSRSVFTGMTLTLKNWAITTPMTEKVLGPVTTSARGRVTVAFNLDFGALFYEDPRHAAADDAKIHQYHLKRHVWDMNANGQIIYNFISDVNTPGGGTAIRPTNVSLTGTGWFIHRYTEVKIKDEAIDKIEGYTYAGLAPLRIMMTNVQYQKRDLFPGFGTTSPAPAPAP